RKPTDFRSTSASYPPYCPVCCSSVDRPGVIRDVRMTDAKPIPAGINPQRSPLPDTEGRKFLIREGAGGDLVKCEVLCRQVSPVDSRLLSGFQCAAAHGGSQRQRKSVRQDLLAIENNKRVHD